MRTAPEILKENPMTMIDLMGPDGEKLVQRLIWLGQVEVINRVAINDAHKLTLLREIKYKDNGEE